MQSQSVKACFADVAAGGVGSNPHLIREKRAAAIAALRERQKVEATAVRKRIIKEEKQYTKAARRLQQHIGMN
ncbi:MAG: hypothetical protein ABL867_05735 [Rickettsiales bacterium]